MQDVALTDARRLRTRSGHTRRLSSCATCKQDRSHGVSHVPLGTPRTQEPICLARVALTLTRALLAHTEPRATDARSPTTQAHPLCAPAPVVGSLEWVRSQQVRRSTTKTTGEVGLSALEIESRHPNGWTLA